jgi:subtilisin family serine protease
VRIEIARKATLSDAEIASLGLVPVYRREDAVLAAYAREADLSTFAGQVDSYRHERKKLLALAKIDAIKPWTRDDRLGPRLREQQNQIATTNEYAVDLLLMPAHDETQNPQAIRAVERFVQRANGRVVDRAIAPTLAVLRVRLRGQALNELLDYRDDVALVELPPAVEIAVPSVFSLSVDDVPDIDPIDDRAPAICVVDSGILEGHPLLEPAMISAKSRSFPATLGPPVPKPPVTDAGHGTQVAGIALYADVAACASAKRFTPELRLVNARVLDDKNELDPNRMPLMHDIVDHVRDMCRVINLSFGLDSHAGFLSVPAVELDTLTREAGVLFVVSAGNVRLPSRYGNRRPTTPYPGYLLDPGWTVRAPGEALNALTVGGITPDGTLFRPTASRTPFAPPRAPAPFGCSGGIKNVIKPELVEVAGNLAYDTSGGGFWVDNDAGLRVATTSHEFVKGNLLGFQSGTSSSTPKVSHLAARLLARYPDATTNLLRALLIQSARFPAGVSVGRRRRSCASSDSAYPISTAPSTADRNA